jgi:hypothetical protein
MRQTCIFCDNPLDGSDEHIIPDSLNGRLHSKSLICKKCNQKFGDHLDPVLKETLFMQLHLFGFDNAKTFIVKDDQGNPYKVDQHGKVNPVKVNTENVELNGMPGISVSGKMEDAAEAFVKKMIRTFGKEETRQAALSRQFQLIEKNIVPNTLTGENPLKVTPKLLLALEKIMVEYYAFCDMDTSIISNRLTNIFQLDESKANVTLCNLTQQVRKPGKEETSHLIVLRSNPDTMEVFVYLELFNVVCAYAVLDSDYSGPPVDFSFQQDVADGKKLQQEITLDLRHLSDPAVGFELLTNDLMSRKRDKEMMRCLEANIQAIIDPLEKQWKAGEITEEQCGRMIMEQAAEMTGVLTLLYPDDFSGLPEESIKRGNYFHSRIYSAFRADFEKHYQFLLNQEITLENDKRVWFLSRFHFVLAPPKEGRDRNTVYCHFKTKAGGHEKEIKSFEVFRAFRLPFPETAVWL